MYLTRAGDDASVREIVKNIRTPCRGAGSTTDGLEIDQGSGGGSTVVVVELLAILDVVEDDASVVVVLLLVLVDDELVLVLLELMLELVLVLVLLDAVLLLVVVALGSTVLDASVTPIGQVIGSDSGGPGPSKSTVSSCSVATNVTAAAASSTCTWNVNAGGTKVPGGMGPSTTAETESGASSMCDGIGNVLIVAPLVICSLPGTTVAPETAYVVCNC
jgi:hypothetical protein